MSNINEYDIYKELQEQLNNCDALITRSNKEGKERNKAQADYYKIKAKRWILMSAEGYTDTRIKETIKGQDDVNDAMLDMNNKETIYWATQHQIDVCEKRIETLKKIMSLEWGNQK